MPGTMTCNKCGVTSAHETVDSMIAWDGSHRCAPSLPGEILTREGVGYYIGGDAGLFDLVKTAAAYHDLIDRIPSQAALTEIIVGYPSGDAPLLVRAEADATAAAIRHLILGPGAEQ
jgi:hypothetical protein